MNVFIMDDHQMILDWYVTLFGQKFKNWNIISSSEVGKANLVIDKLDKLDLIIVDYKLGHLSNDGVEINGVDFIKKIRKKFPAIKVILITGHEEILLLYHIHKLSTPNGFMVKTDVNADVLVNAIQLVLKGERYYSEQVDKALKQIYKKELLLQEMNINIILLLEKGFRIKEIGEILFISESAVNKRILSLKQTFNVQDNGGLVRIVKKEGFV